MGALFLPTAAEQADWPLFHSHLRGELMCGTRPRGSSAMRRAGMKAQMGSPQHGERSWDGILFCANLTVCHFFHPLGICWDVRGRTHSCRSGISNIPSAPRRPTSGRQNIVPGSGAEGHSSILRPSSTASYLPTLCLSPSTKGDRLPTIQSATREKTGHFSKGEGEGLGQF